MIDCKTCELVHRRDAGQAPPWDAIYRTGDWDVVHAYNTSHEGWLVLVARRHVTSLVEMTDGEAQTLGPLVKSVSAALTEVLACEKTYLVQFAEHPDHRHVHIHLIAIGADHPSELRGPTIFDRLDVDDAQRVSAARMNELAIDLRRALGVA